MKELTINSAEKLFFYNAMDCMITRELLDKLLPQLDTDTSTIYSFERGLQAPILETMLRGILIDQAERWRQLQDAQEKLARLESILNQLAEAVWEQPLNPRSPKQIADFFYGHMKLPPVWLSFKGEKRISTNREALEKLTGYYWAQLIVRTILAARDQAKLCAVLKSGVDKDSRIRTSYNIGGTSTGRLSSSENAFGTGMNLQNVTEQIRPMFIPDPGFKLAYIDLEQAESRAVALISGDVAYWEACHSGDLHTTTAKMVWNKLPWDGTPKGDRAVANQKFYRDFSYRDMSKRGGHGTNYRGFPSTMARYLKVQTAVMEEFRRAYFTAFPGIPRWHENVSRQLTLTGQLTTPLGRRRAFFGRRDDDATLRKAIAYGPQSLVGDILNLGMWRVWKSFPEVQILAQIHDAILIQYPESLELKLIPQILKALEVTVSFQNRRLTIPAEALTGWNWGKVSEKNIHGLKAFKNDIDSRQRPKLQGTSILDCWVQ